MALGTAGFTAMLAVMAVEGHGLTPDKGEVLVTGPSGAGRTTAIRALEALKGGPHRVELYTDSSYVKDGISGWIHGWKRNGWKTAARKPVKNAELWQELDELTRRHDIHWHWIKGHAGHPENERADELAREGMAWLAGCAACRATTWSRCRWRWTW